MSKFKAINPKDIEVFPGGGVEWRFYHPSFGEDRVLVVDTFDVWVTDDPTLLPLKTFGRADTAQWYVYCGVDAADKPEWKSSGKASKEEMEILAPLLEQAEEETGEKITMVWSKEELDRRFEEIKKNYPNDVKLG